jgi:hypothetical protein
MLIKLTGLVITPRLPKSFGGIYKWAKEVNTALQQLRDRVVIIPTTPTTTKTETSDTVSECDFGIIIETPALDPEDQPTYAIRGGYVNCGDQNWNFDNQDINTSANGRWLVYLVVDCEVNQDDNNELLLPGVKTGTKPTGDWDQTPYTGSENYPPNNNPEAGAGTGTITLPIGVLTITDGIPTFNNTGCGGFMINHCSGTLSFSR